jgi:hypothetical protein
MPWPLRFTGFALADGKFNTTTPGGTYGHSSRPSPDGKAIDVVNAWSQSERAIGRNVAVCPGHQGTATRIGSIRWSRERVRRSRKEKGSCRGGDVAWEGPRIVGACGPTCDVIAADARIGWRRRQTWHSDRAANHRMPRQADAAIGAHISEGIRRSAGVCSIVRSIKAVGGGVAVAAAVEV